MAIPTKRMCDVLGEKRIHNTECKEIRKTTIDDDGGTVRGVK